MLSSNREISMILGKCFIPEGDDIFLVNPMSVLVHQFSKYLSQLNT